MSLQYKHTKTPGQERRRLARLARRAARRAEEGRQYHVSPYAKRQRSSFRVRRSLRKAAQDAAMNVAAIFARNLDALAQRISQAERCPYVRVYQEQENGPMVTGDPCGGRLRRSSAGALICRQCGREWMRDAKPGQFKPVTA